VYRVSAKKPADSVKERCSASGRAKAKAASNGCAIAARQLVCDDDSTARSLMNEQRDEEQRGQEDNEKHARHESLKQRQPQWREKFHAREWA